MNSKSEIKSKDSLELMLLNNSETRSETSLSSSRFSSMPEVMFLEIILFFSILISEKSFLAYPFEIIPHLGEL